MFKNLWYPVAASAEVTSAPVATVCLGQDLVAWRQPRSGAVIVMSDLCVHRGAAISGGWIDGEHLVCPYHGWEYDDTGACVRIPAQQDSTRGIPRKARVDAYPAVEAAGLVWAFLGDLPEAERPSPPMLVEMPGSTLLAPVTVAASYERVLEHLLSLGGTLTVGEVQAHEWSARATAIAGPAAGLWPEGTEVEAAWQLPSLVTLHGAGVGMLAALTPLGPTSTQVRPAVVGGAVAERTVRTLLAALADVVSDSPLPEAKPADELAAAYRRRRNELVDAGWGIEAHRIAGDEPVAEAVVIPSPTRREVPELARAWVFKEVPASPVEHLAV